MPNFSSLLESIPPSATLAVNDKARAMQAAGLDIVVLGGGDPDFDTPAHIVEAGISAIKAGKTHYPAPAKGTPDLLEAIGRKMRRENGVTVDPGSQIVVTPGSKWALFIALAALTNPGDEIIYLEPAWVSYEPMIRLTGGTPVAVPLSWKDNFAITTDLLNEKITKRTKALLVNSPCNPTGRVLTADEVSAVTAVALANDIYVITDEVYEKLIYDGREHRSLAAEPGMSERTLTTNGLSKAYAMTGWRLGWLAGPAPIIKLAGKMHGQAVTSAATFTMAAAVAALNGPQDIVREMCASYLDRRDFMVDALNTIPGIDCPSPEGAFYLLPRFTGTGLDSLELADALLNQAGIAATPGIAFGASAEQHIRFSIASAQSELEKAVDRLAKIVPSL
ncbi:MAG TPA: pyridoxal phosphate-dependent aminotransferase [candidate division Zixibacteria bacterium]|nr:pyridoxal phosphate-dependent aminotransferase [candidate division Zixibacteria bacterium]